MRAIVDGQVIDAAAARVPATDGGLIHGDGVFEVIRVYRGQAFALDEHIERMARSATNLRIAFDDVEVRADVEALLAAGDPGDCLLRVLVTVGGRRIAILEPLKIFPDALDLITIEYSPPLILDGVKSLSYGANMQASRLARESGGDEALLVTPHGRVLEAPTSSFFYSMDGRALYTPPLSEHILDSITRRHVIAATDVVERPLRVGELPGLSEAFLASTLREVLPVRAIDRCHLATPGPLTSRAVEATRERIASLL